MAGFLAGTSVTRGGSATSTSEPPARVAVELLEGGSRPRSAAPEDAIPAFLALLDTEVTWS